MLPNTLRRGYGKYLIHLSETEYKALHSAGKRCSNVENRSKIREEIMIACTHQSYRELHDIVVDNRWNESEYGMGWLVTRDTQDGDGWIVRGDQRYEYIGNKRRPWRTAESDRHKITVSARFES